MSGDVETPVVVSFKQFIELCQALARKVVDSGIEFDAYLVLANGGLVPGGFMAKIFEPIFGKMPVLTLTMSNYKPDGTQLESPIVLEEPPEIVYFGKRILIIDDVWHTGKTLAKAKKMVARANGSPIVATLHYKPTENLIVDQQPDFFVEETSHWIQYPWEDPAILLQDVPSRIRSTP